MKLEYKVLEVDSGKPLKSILKNILQMSEKLITKLKYGGMLTINGIPCIVTKKVITGDTILVDMSAAEEVDNMVPENLPLSILYEDEALIAIDKPNNMVVHPTSLHQSGTIANAVLYHTLAHGSFSKVRPISRLDRTTTGIILFAKNAYVQECMIRQMQKKIFVKEYLGLVHGIVGQDSGTINFPIERKPDSIILRHVSQTGAPSVTHYEVVSYFSNATLLKLRLETGRTHQIRVHCQAMAHPLVGDQLYSDYPTQLINRQALHAHRVSFVHPITKNTLELTSQIPSDMLQLFRTLKI